MHRGRKQSTRHDINPTTNEMLDMQFIYIYKNNDEFLTILNE